MMRTGLIALAACASLMAQVGDVQKLVEELYPKNERMKTMRVADLVRELHIGPGSIVGDVGCGSGEFSVILAKVVAPAGRVYCVDVDDLKDARRTFKRYDVRNVTTVKGSDDNPRLAPASLDGVLIVNAYHEMVDHQEMLRHVREALKPGARLVLCDNTPHRTASRSREAQTNNHVIAEATVAADLEAAGFRIEKRDSAFIDDPDSESQHWLIVAQSK